MPVRGAKKSTTHRTFIAAARSRASAVFREGETLAITYSYDGSPAATIRFQTRYRELGFPVTVPEDLWADIRGNAESIKEVIEVFVNGARDLTNILAISANAYMGHIEPEVIYESTPNINSRPFFQSFVPQPPITMVPGRLINRKATMDLIGSLQRHTRRDRFMRAIAQYHLALENWSLGGEVLSVSHLFMAIEALKHIARDSILDRRGITEHELAVEWGFVDGRSQNVSTFLLNEARRRVLFRDDDGCHRKAKRISDDFEHGFTNFGLLRHPASEVIVPLAGYVRGAIIELANLPENTAKALLSEPYLRARGPLRMVKYIYGKLLGDSEDLARPENVYPIFEWRSKLNSVARNEDGSSSFSPKETVTAQFADKVRFQGERAELWDGSIIQGTSIEIADEPSD